MKLPEFCIKRPAFTIVLSLLLVMFGLLAFRTTQVSWLPRIVVPVIAINTSYPGASATTIEGDVTTIIENALSGINGTDYITSISANGESTITVYFKVGTHLDAAASDIRGAIASVQSQLPREVEQPIISKRDPQARPILIISFVDPHKSIGQLSDYVEQFIKPQLNTVAGVAKLYIWGERKYAMRVWLKPAAMAAQGITVSDITQLLKSQNVFVASGKIRHPERFFTVNTNLKLQTAKDFANLILTDRNNHVVKLGDVATIKIGSENQDTLFQVNGKPGIAIGVIAQSDANPLEVSAAVLKRFANLKAQMPASTNVSTVYNQSDFTNASIHAVYETLVEAVFLVLLVVIAFLGNWRAASIPIVTIPVCLIAAFALINALGYTINTMTLLAMVLSIGLVVDDAIVMLENIERHIRAGESPLSAALIGSRQIAFALIAMTITLAAVYAPLGFATGITGEFFRQFAFTLAGTVIISGFVALTLSPMMCGHILPANQHENAYQRWVNRIIAKFTRAYEWLLQWSTPKRALITLIFFAIIAAGAYLYRSLPNELAPAMDQSLVNVYATPASDASFSNTAAYIVQISDIIKDIPGVKSYLPQIFSLDLLYVLAVLEPKEHRELSDAQIAAIIEKRAQKIRGLRISAAPNPPPLASYSAGTGDDPSKIPFVIQTTSSYAALQKVVDQFKKDISHWPGFTDVTTFTKWNTLQIDLTIDRELAADLQIPMQDITNTIGTMLGSRWIGNYTFNGKNYKLLVQLNQQSLKQLDAIEQMFVKSNKGEMIPLSSLVTLKYVTKPLTYLHFNRLRADAIMSRLSANTDMNQAIQFLSQLKKRLPNDFEATFAGSARSFLSASHEMNFLLIVAIIFIYLVLTAQFGNFIDPIVILLTVPFAAVGALFTLWLVGASLNFYSQIGIITLMGLIAKNGVLITDFANALVSQGKTLQHAVIQAATQRLRPILMTAGAMILGALPLALASGAGAEDRQQIGWVIVGGLFFGTIFSLLIIPSAYLLFAKLKRQK